MLANISIWISIGFALFCLYVAIACFISASRSYELPDIEDLEL